MGTGEAEGEDRAMKAADMAISNPLLDDVTMKGAKGVLINITGGPDLMLFEVEQAANRIRAEVDPDANIIFGNTILEDMEGRIRVSVVATGIDAEALAKMPPNVEPLRPRARPMPLPNAVAQRGAQLQQPMPNPVRAQLNTIAEQVRAEAAMPPAPRQPISPIEPLILGNDQENETVEEDIPPMPAIVRQAQPLREMLPEPKPEPKRRRLFGGWSSASRRCAPNPRRCPVKLRRSARPHR